MSGSQLFLMFFFRSSLFSECLRRCSTAWRMGTDLALVFQVSLGGEVLKFKVAVILT